MPRARSRLSLSSDPVGSRPFALKNQIEAILYLKGQPLELATIADLADCLRSEAYEALLELMEDYAHRDSALEVMATDEQFALQLRQPFLPLVESVLPPELNVGAMRTLAVIILRGPIAQVDLVQLRGANAYQHVAELVEKGFVTKHRQPGNRSSILQVTDKFHRYFSVDELAATGSLPEELHDSDPPSDE